MAEHLRRHRDGYHAWSKQGPKKSFYCVPTDELLRVKDDLFNEKHLKNVGPIRHSELLHAALPFTWCRYCRVARRLRIDVHDDDDDNDNA